MKRLILAVLMSLCLFGVSHGQKDGLDKPGRPEKPCPERPRERPERERDVEKTCPAREGPTDKPFRERREGGGEKGAGPTKDSRHDTH
ncbi:MAG TPA: hypothetical protein VNZ44_13725 [Pyrinomonadaceae bacterium]|nr:hypothetical protein [Pyrinomonadaceae bacterium]